MTTEKPQPPEHIRDAEGQRIAHALMHLMREPYLTIADRPIDLTDIENGVGDEYGPFWVLLHPDGNTVHDLIIEGPFEHWDDSEAFGKAWHLSLVSRGGKAGQA